MATTLLRLCAVLLVMSYLAFVVLSARWVWKLTHGQAAMSTLMVLTATLMVLLMILFRAFLVGAR